LNYKNTRTHVIVVLRVTKHYTLRMNIWQYWSTVLSRWAERVQSQRWLLYCTVKFNARQL